jgi:hypothetical protein
MADYYTNSAVRNAGSYTTHDPSMAQIVYYGILKIWSGAAWVAKTLKIYIGGIWVNKPLYRWDGSEWLLVKSEI